MLEANKLPDRLTVLGQNDGVTVDGLLEATAHDDETVAVDERFEVRDLRCLFQ